MDNGREFALTKLNEITLKEGFTIATIIIDTPYQNGKIEKAGRIIVTNTRIMLISCGLPKHLWLYVEETIIRILNLLPDDTNLGNLSPYQTICQALGLQKEL